jgi:carbonic anhydrase
MRMKRAFVHAVAALLLAMVLLSATGCTSGPSAPAAQAAVSPAVTPDEALGRLKQGNARFAHAALAAKDFSPTRREALVAGQKPFAVIVCCSDSRVPPELVFDQGLGDIFVVRVAGNVVDPLVLGSVEYGVEHLHSPLVVVLGHQNCGAVQAAVAGGEAPADIEAIVARITPSVRRAQSQPSHPPDITELVTDLNVRNSLSAIAASPIVSHLAHDGKVRVVGAKYHLDTGTVEWFAP